MAVCLLCDRLLGTDLALGLAFGLPAADAGDQRRWIAKRISAKREAKPSAHQQSGLTALDGFAQGSPCLGHPPGQIRDRSGVGLFSFLDSRVLEKGLGLHLKDIGLYAWIPFVFGGLGGVLGGMASDRLIRAGLSPAAARRRLLYSAAGLAPIGMLTGLVSSAGFSIALIALMAFVCYVWFINTAALVSDIFPERVVGSIQGLMGTTGSIGGMVFTWLAGLLLDSFSSYKPVFVIAGSGHLLGALILWSLMRDKRDLLKYEDYRLESPHRNRAD